MVIALKWDIVTQVTQPFYAEAQLRYRAPDNSEQLIDFTGMDLRMDLREEYTSNTVSLHLSTDNGFIYPLVPVAPDDPSDPDYQPNNLAFSVPESTMMRMKVRSYVYDCRYYQGSRILFGAFKIDWGVTRS